MEYNFIKCGRRIMVITAASQAAHASSILVARSNDFFGHSSYNGECLLVSFVSEFYAIQDLEKNGMRFSEYLSGFKAKAVSCDESTTRTRRWDRVFRQE